MIELQQFCHHAMQRFLLRGQSIQFAIVPSFIAIKSQINLFSLGTHAMSFHWKLCPLLSSSCVDSFFVLLLLANMPQNDSVFLCTVNPKAVSHQNEFVLHWLLIPARPVVIQLCIAFQGAMSFSPEGKIASSHKKVARMVVHGACYLFIKLCVGHKMWALKMRDMLIIVLLN